MKSFKNINKNNLYFGEKILLGTYSTDWSTYELEVESTIQSIKNGFPTPFWESDKDDENYLNNLKNIMLDNFQNFAGRNIAVIKIDEYSCVCVYDPSFSKSTDYQLLLLTNPYVCPFDNKRRYPTQMIETKTTWKY